MKTLRQLSSLFLTFSLGSLLSCGGGSSGGGGAGGTQGMTTISGPGAAVSQNSTLLIPQNYAAVINQFKTNHQCTRGQDEIFHMPIQSIPNNNNTTSYNNDTNFFGFDSWRLMGFPLMPNANTPNNSYGNTPYGSTLTPGTFPSGTYAIDGVVAGKIFNSGVTLPNGRQLVQPQELLFILLTKSTSGNQVLGYTFVYSPCANNVNGVNVSNTIYKQAWLKSSALQFLPKNIQTLGSGSSVIITIQMGFFDSPGPHYVDLTFQGDNMNITNIPL